MADLVLLYYDHSWDPFANFAVELRRKRWGIPGLGNSMSKTREEGKYKVSRLGREWVCPLWVEQQNEDMGGECFKIWLGRAGVRQNCEGP